MSNQKQPRPGDMPDEKTIEENLKKMNYPATEDIMRQSKEIDADLEITDKQASTVDQLKPGNG